LFLLPSQSANPVLQTGAHTPAEHDVVPLAFVQETPQAPQLVALVFVFVSQPLFGLPSQSAKPVLHVGLQAPDVHVVDPFAFVQVTPQLPQLVVVLSAASQPLDKRPSQLPQPALHVIEHAPREQDGVPFVELQTVPHAPQLATLVCVLISHPFEATPSQFPNPELQLWIAQDPEPHVAVALARLHATPQPPQFVSVLRAASHPFEATPSQLPNPELHTPSAHAPALHVAEALA
jgi:hypothetical protein